MPLFLWLFSPKPPSNFSKHKSFGSRGPLEVFRNDFYAFWFFEVLVEENRFPSLKGDIFGYFLVLWDRREFSQLLRRRRVVFSALCDFFSKKIHLVNGYPVHIDIFRLMKAFCEVQSSFRFFGIMKLFQKKNFNFFLYYAIFFWFSNLWEKLPKNVKSSSHNFCFFWGFLLKKTVFRASVFPLFSALKDFLLFGFVRLFSIFLISPKGPPSIFWNFATEWMCKKSQRVPFFQFFWHHETSKYSIFVFLRKFFEVSKKFLLQLFDILQRNRCWKISKSPFTVFGVVSFSKWIFLSWN